MLLYELKFQMFLDTQHSSSFKAEHKILCFTL